MGPAYRGAWFCGLKILSAPGITPNHSTKSSARYRNADSYLRRLQCWHYAKPALLEFMKDNFNLDSVTESSTTFGNSYVCIMFATKDSAEPVPYSSYLCYRRQMLNRLCDTHYLQHNTDFHSLNTYHTRRIHKTYSYQFCDRVDDTAHSNHFVT
jgi:hypothetical protein